MSKKKPSKENSENPDPFSLIPDDFDAKFTIIPTEETDNWVTLNFRMPKNFQPIFEMTLEAYKALLLTDKDFPAFEAMIIEAKNSIIQHTND